MNYNEKNAVRRVTLETLLHDHFGCGKPVLRYPVPDDYDSYNSRYLTRRGQKAYAKLIDLLYDLEELTDISFCFVIEELDDIADGHSCKLQ